MRQAFRHGIIFGGRLASFSFAVLLVIAAMVGTGLIGQHVYAQLNQSGGPGSTVTANIGTTNGLALDSSLTTANTNLTTIDTDLKSNITLHAGAAVIGHVIVDTAPTTAVTFAAPALAAGVANIGLVRAVPSSCTQATNFTNATVGVATATGTTVTSTTTCVTFGYVNNITNSPVTFRLADKAGTPVIWVGGNADFTIPANSNFDLGIAGVTFTSGITAIAGTAAALNLQIAGLQ